MHGEPLHLLCFVFPSVAPLLLLGASFAVLSPAARAPRSLRESTYFGFLPGRDGIRAVSFRLCEAVHVFGSRRYPFRVPLQTPGCKPEDVGKHFVRVGGGPVGFGRGSD